LQAGNIGCFFGWLRSVKIECVKYKVSFDYTEEEHWIREIVKSAK